MLRKDWRKADSENNKNKIKGLRRRRLQTTGRHKQHKGDWNRYTDLKWSIVTDHRRINCLSEESCTVPAVQSPVLQFALQEDTAPGVTKQRHRKRHDRSIALDRYTHTQKKRFPLLAEYLN